MATKLEGGGKALVAEPLKELLRLPLPLFNFARTNELLCVHCTGRDVHSLFNLDIFLCK